MKIKAEFKRFELPRKGARETKKASFVLFFSSAAVLLLALVNVSCSSLSKKDCQEGDWYGLGAKDGQKGMVSSRFDTYVKECAEHGVTPVQALYSQGREEGLKVFCTPRSGYRVGKSLTAYAKVCPKDLEGPFLEAYHFGRKVGEMEAEIKRIDSEIADNETQLEKPIMDSWSKSSIRERIRTLNRKQRELERSIDRLKTDNKLDQYED